VSKGETTKTAILDRATTLARTVGLSGLTIGQLAEELALSKSGLFAHFGSKEALQVAVVQHGRQQFVDTVVLPSFKEKRGEPRIRSLFERWITWGAQRGGCILLAASFEVDDQDGAIRDEVTASQRDWMGVLAQAARIAIEEGHFRRDLDVDQFAFEVEGIMLAFHLALRLLRDPRAADRAKRAFQALVAHSRA
jgi:AcrR family transcriptional regulator